MTDDEDESEVRGREEIKAIVTDLDALLEEARGNAHPLLVERLSQISHDLKGEVDDL